MLKHLTPERLETIREQIYDPFNHCTLSFVELVEFLRVVEEYRKLKEKEDRVQRFWKEFVESAEWFAGFYDQLPDKKERGLFDALKSAFLECLNDNYAEGHMAGWCDYGQAEKKGESRPYVIAVNEDKPDPDEEEKTDG